MRIVKENSFKYGLNNVSVEAKDESTLDALIAKINDLGWKDAWTTCVEDCTYGWSTTYAVDCTLYEDFKISFSEAKVALKADKNLVKSSEQQSGVVVIGIHVGSIVSVKDGQISQKTGRDPDKVVWHDISKLVGPVPKVGEMAEIKYKEGIGEVSGPGISASKER